MPNVSVDSILAYVIITTHRSTILKGKHLNLYKSFFAVSIALTLSACAHFKNNTDSSNEATAETADLSSKKEAPEYGDFSLEDDTLYDLLVAEIAAQRNQLNVTLLNYIQQARHTRDPDVIRRAINAAQFSKDPIAVKELGLLWTEAEPENPLAHQLMAYQYSIEKQYSDAIYHIDRVIELGGNISIESLAIGSQALPEKDKQELLALYEKLLKKHPESHPIRYSLAIVQSNLNQPKEALANLDYILARNENFQAAYVLKSTILYENGTSKEATMDFVEDAYERFPTNHAIGRLWAGLLIDQMRLEEAEEVFLGLMRHYPQSTAFKLSHALVILENKKVDEAKASLNELLALGAHTNEVHFYLGRIEDQQGNIETAIKHYLAINAGTHREPSLERAGYLLMKEGKFDEAIAALSDARTRDPELATIIWGTQFKLLHNFGETERALSTLNEALELYPDSEQLLYARAMLYDTNQELPLMEADLKRILAINPKNAVAMNALGYTLADKTDRLDEALQLISFAMQIKPNNPAIKDSMGWVLYKLGRNEEALIFLIQAFQQYPDGEVGAHLGEVLLSLGQTTEANEVWNKALENNSNHPTLIETLQRLAPELLPSIEDSSEQAITGENEASDSTTPTSGNEPAKNSEENQSDAEQ